MTSSALTYRYVAMTDVGLRRSNNEDSGYAGPHFFAIADGMGGAAAGDLASSTTMNVLRSLDHEHDIDALTALGGAVELANSRLGQLIADDPAVEGMGTTVEAMLWDGEKLAWAHLGDSRSYRLRSSALTQISADHTFVQSLVDEGRLTAEEARHHPHRSLLLRALLGRDDNAADLSWIQPQAGDRYLLCSDGLSDMVTDDVIEQVLLSSETIDVAATELITKALEAGGVDNVTVVLAEFVAQDAEPHPDLACANGQPQLVGAAAEQPRPPTGRAVAPEVHDDEQPELDEEEMRYAPRPPGKSRWLRVGLILAVIAAILAGAGYAGYKWTQTQYYIGVEGENVAIFRGVDLDIPGVRLSHVQEVTSIPVNSLSQYTRDEIKAGKPADSLSEARATVASFVQKVDPVSPTPTPTPTRKATPKTTPKATPTTTKAPGR